MTKISTNQEIKITMNYHLITSQIGKNFKSDNIKFIQDQKKWKLAPTPCKMTWFRKTRDLQQVAVSPDPHLLGVWMAGAWGFT